MTSSTPLGINEISFQLGRAGLRLAELDAAEGAAGNMSVCLRRPPEVSTVFPDARDLELPHHVPDLAGMMLVVTVSGRRLREVADAPIAHPACVLVEPAGRSKWPSVTTNANWPLKVPDFSNGMPDKNCYGSPAWPMLSCFPSSPTLLFLSAWLLRTFCHRIGKRGWDTLTPLCRLRFALSLLWLTHPPPFLSRL